MAKGRKAWGPPALVYGFLAFHRIRFLGEGFPHVGKVSSYKVANVSCYTVAALSAAGMKEYRNHERRAHMRFAGLTQPLYCLPSKKMRSPFRGPEEKMRGC
jgi:hypothetical protein